MSNNKETILELEHAALDRWGEGNPSGFLALYDDDISYFDNTLERRLDGFDALSSMYESVRGKIHVDHYELVNPKLQHCGNCSILSYNLISYAGEDVYHWNCTEVYRKSGNGWRIIHTHWSVTQQNT